MNRFRDLREELEITQSQLAKKLNLSQQTISGYENGSRFPDQEILEKIADFFNVSIDYLLGRTDIKKTYEDKSHLTTKAYHNLDVSGLSEEDIEAVEKIVESLKKKYDSDGSLRK